VHSPSEEYRECVDEDMNEKKMQENKKDERKI